MPPRAARGRPPVRARGRARGRRGGAAGQGAQTSSSSFAPALVSESMLGAHDGPQSQLLREVVRDFTRVA